jgi:hypothetical protein
VKSNAEIRQILKDFESDNASKLFGKAGVSAAAVGGCCATDHEGVGPDGTATLMNIEMNKESAAKGKNKDKGKGKGAANKAPTSKKKAVASKGDTAKKK